jgi:hypothetical protein
MFFVTQHFVFYVPIVGQLALESILFFVVLFVLHFFAFLYLPFVHHSFVLTSLFVP